MNGGGIFVSESKREMKNAIEDSRIKIMNLKSKLKISTETLWMIKTNYVKIYHWGVNPSHCASFSGGDSGLSLMNTYYYILSRDTWNPWINWISFGNISFLVCSSVTFKPISCFTSLKGQLKFKVL